MERMIFQREVVFLQLHDVSCQKVNDALSFAMLIIFFRLAVAVFVLSKSERRLETNSGNTETTLPRKT